MTYPMPFNNPYTYAGHGGIDYAQPQGTPIRAVADGTITFSARWTVRAGLTRTLTLDNGLQMMHCHLVNLNGPAVGTRVRAGEVIAYVGSTGFSTGNHLHHELWYRGVKQSGSLYWNWIDRNRVISASGSGAGGGGGGVTPTPTPEPKPEIKAEEEDAMYVIVFNGIHYLISKQFITHLPGGAKLKYAKEIASSDKKVHDFGRGNAASAEWQNFLATFDVFGVPRNVIGNGKDGEGLILNPENGNFERGGTWSREREDIALNRKILAAVQK